MHACRLRILLSVQFAFDDKWVQESQFRTVSYGALNKVFKSRDFLEPFLDISWCWIYSFGLHDTTSHTHISQGYSAIDKPLLSSQLWIQVSQCCSLLFWVSRNKGLAQLQPHVYMRCLFCAQGAIELWCKGATQVPCNGEFSHKRNVVYCRQHQKGKVRCWKSEVWENCQEDKNNL